MIHFSNFHARIQKYGLSVCYHKVLLHVLLFLFHHVFIFITTFITCFTTSTSFTVNTCTYHRYFTVLFTAFSTYSLIFSQNPSSLKSTNRSRFPTSEFIWAFCPFSQQHFGMCKKYLPPSETTSTLQDNYYTRIYHIEKSLNIYNPPPLLSPLINTLREIYIHAQCELHSVRGKLK